MVAAVEEVITGSDINLGDFSVQRVLPTPKRQLVGPFIFFDHIAPLTLEAGQKIYIRPHPHIGLAAVTYLFRGEMVHRDSLGCVQSIRPGDVNWMIAGRGITHSECSALDDIHKRKRYLHGIQAWVALPVEHEETAAEFYNHARRDLPEFEHEGVIVRLLVGRAFSKVSPVKTFSDMFYLDVKMKTGQSFAMPGDHMERAFFLVEGEVTMAENIYHAGQMVILAQDADAVITAGSETRMITLGGAPLCGARHLWWNFVSSRPEWIEKAKRDWAEGRFDPVPGVADFIPLPE